jgi:hypothetical protein
MRYLDGTPRRLAAPDADVVARQNAADHGVQTIIRKRVAVSL